MMWFAIVIGYLKVLSIVGCVSYIFISVMKDIFDEE